MGVATSIGDSAGEVLHNGIELPEQWPPKDLVFDRQPMPVPYLENPPEVIPIDVGRQLFVDDFLIEETTLKRAYHSCQPYVGNPVLEPTEPWEKEPADATIAFSDGIWWDPDDQFFKMWYWGGHGTRTCYAISKDGIQFIKPRLEVIESGTNVVLENTRNSSTVWLDHEETDPARRFKMFSAIAAPPDNRLEMRQSGDGIHWSEPLAIGPIIGDRTTVFYNPFRKVWVYSIRHRLPPPPKKRTRVRLYLEDPDPPSRFPLMETEMVNWLEADDLDPRHPRFPYFDPELYNFDATPYESLMVGSFSILEGPDKSVLNERELNKQCEILLGFSRDGFHWSRPDRKPFIGVDPKRGSWNEANVQSVGGGFVVVGDWLYCYHSGRRHVIEGRDGPMCVGLGFLRRDGFASMSADDFDGTLTTRPVVFNGLQLFVNVDCPRGEMKVEILDVSGETIGPFVKEVCFPVSDNATLKRIVWEGAKDLSSVSGSPVRIRFHLRKGSLYSFWVSSDQNGASHGYVAGGGPGFDGPVDSVGAEGYKAASTLPSPKIE